MGMWWNTRMECCADGVHRPPVSGIHGGDDGAYSIALSGGYEDDLDFGGSFTYTGEGGRDLKGTKANPKVFKTGEKITIFQLPQYFLRIARIFFSN